MLLITLRASARMSTKAEVRAAEHEAESTANTMIDIVLAIVVIAVAFYLTTSFSMPDGGIELVLTVFFGTLFWLLATVMLYRMVSLILTALEAEPET